MLRATTRLVLSARAAAAWKSFPFDRSVSPTWKSTESGLKCDQNTIEKA